MGANLLQAVGGILNIKWVIQRAVEEGPVCSAQGAVKQAGNVGAAVWYDGLTLDNHRRAHPVSKVPSYLDMRFQFDVPEV